MSDSATTANRPEASSPIPALAGRLRAVLAPLSRQLRQQSSDSLSATEISVLGTIRRHGPIALGGVAYLEHLSPSRISKVVESLEAHGFVGRSQDPDDRRVWLVSATPEAESWIEQGRAKRDAWLADRLVRLSEEEIATLTAAVDVLERIVAQDNA